MFVRSDFSVLKAPSLFRWHDADSYRMLPILYPNTWEPGFAYLYSPQPSSPFCLSCPSAFLVLQRGVIVPRECLGAKNLLGPLMSIVFVVVALIFDAISMSIPTMSLKH